MHSIDPALAVRWDDDRVVEEADRKTGKMPSTWVIVAHDMNDLGKLRTFTPLHGKRGPIWTDDHASLWGVWKASEE